MSAWIEPPPAEAPCFTALEELQLALGGRQQGARIAAQILAQRGLTDLAAVRAFLDPDCYVEPAPCELPGLSQAADRVEAALRSSEPVCVWGDFDVDGQTATTILVSCLRQLGGQVSFHIPVRARESHGVNLPQLNEIIGCGTKLVVTCDTGITAQAAVEEALQQGVDFVITDHHELPAVLPRACAVTNPHLLPEAHPLASLPGAGVAYELALELFRRFDRAGETQNLLDLAALGIVADLAPLIGQARYLLQRGLPVLRSTPRLGLKAMMKLAELNPARLTEEHIAFMLGPRLNALGRLADANSAVEFFTTTDAARAQVLAQQMEQYNSRRKLLTRQVFEAALAQIDREPSALDYAALVLWHPQWPGGVVGIVASHLAERFHRPVVLISTPPGELARGSARSIEGVDITKAIATQADMISGYGGHAMAAGLALLPDRLAEFRRGLSRAIQSQVGGELPQATLQIDAYVPLSDLSIELVEDLERLAPFGAGNPPLTLCARRVKLVNAAPLGREEEHRQVILEDEAGEQYKVIWWQGAGWELPQGVFDLAYHVRTSDYRGAPQVQVEWNEARPIEQGEAPLEIQAPRIEVVNYRGQPQPLGILHKLRSEGDVQVWAEGEARQKVTGLDRAHLAPAPRLAIWTTPPGPQELQAALEAAQPQVIYLFGIDPAEGGEETFLMRFAGIVKYVINKTGGKTTLDELAAASAQRAQTVQAALLWLAAQGHVQIVSEKDGALMLAQGSGQISAEFEGVKAKLQALLAETRAYREYFGKMRTLPGIKG